jgi:hypothetical protein
MGYAQTSSGAETSLAAMHASTYSLAAARPLSPSDSCCAARRAVSVLVLISTSSVLGFPIIYECAHMIQTKNQRLEWKHAILNESQFEKYEVTQEVETAWMSRKCKERIRTETLGRLTSHWFSRPVQNSAGWSPNESSVGSTLRTFSSYGRWTTPVEVRKLESRETIHCRIYQVTSSFVFASRKSGISLFK